MCKQQHFSRIPKIITTKAANKQWGRSPKIKGNTKEIKSRRRPSIRGKSTRQRMSSLQALMKMMISIKEQILVLANLITEIWISRISVTAPSRRMVLRKTHRVLTRQAHLRAHLPLKSSKRRILKMPKSSSKRPKRPKSKRKTKESIAIATPPKMHSRTQINSIIKRLSPMKNWQ